MEKHRSVTLGLGGLTTPLKKGYLIIHYVKSHIMYEHSSKTLENAVRYAYELIIGCFTKESERFGICRIDFTLSCVRWDNKVILCPN